MTVTTPEQGLSLREGAESGGNPLKLRRIHHVEFWVGNAKQASFYYRKAFGFSQLAYSGLETGNRQFASYVVSQNKVRFVLSTPFDPQHAASDHIRMHGDRPSSRMT
jgi:4-hydroxyphenylpyruvate dioxygenase